MNQLGLPLDRLRLELDRTLRTRSFFARAVTGRLQRLEYAALISQLTFLLDTLTCGAARELVEVGRQDVTELAPVEVESTPCKTVLLLLDTTRSLKRVAIPRRDAYDLCLLIIGTSWATDAADSLTRTFPGATRLLVELSARSPQSLQRVGSHLVEGKRDAETIYAFAELGRGALLGLAAHLDHVWPSPLGVLDLDDEEGARASIVQPRPGVA